MSTNAIIGIQNDNNTIHAIYLHHDGYPEGAGEILFNHYNSKAKVQRLLALGDLSSLYPYMAPPQGVEHSFDHPYPNVCVAYHRDRQEDLNSIIIPVGINPIEDMFHYGGSYVYLYKNNQWYIASYGQKRWTRLATVLHKKAEKEYTFQASTVTRDCIQWIQKWFRENGPDCTAVIGISGGKDSTVVAALLARALGRSRVLGVLLPQGQQADFQDAKRVVEYLDIPYINLNIYQTCDTITKAIEKQLHQRVSAQTRINLPPRVRMTILYGISQSVNGRVVNTSNYSENYVGYATRYGDTAGDFAPLANLTVEEVKAIGYELCLPEHLIEKVPADGLCSKTDEDNLGFTYQELDNYLRRGIEPRQEALEKIVALHDKNLFKSQDMPAFKPKN